MINQIFNESFLIGMQKIPSNSVDMILTDLPYGTTGCKWDIIIPFDKMWPLYNSVIKNKGAIALFGTEPFSSLLRLSNLGMYKYDWRWVKNDATDAMNAKNRPMRKIENISIFSSGTTANKSKNKMPYFPQGLSPSKIKRQGNDYGKTGGSFKQYRPSHKAYTQELTGFPCDVLYFSKDNEKLHPTQKPVALIEYLIKTYTKEGETVLDTCMGSGTTAIACINTNRNYIGFEDDEKSFNISQERIKRHKNAPKQTNIFT